MAQRRIIKEILSIRGQNMSKVVDTAINYEALYFEELQKRHKAEDENERLTKALISVCLKLDDKK